MANAIVSSLSPEQKLQRLRAAFFIYEKHRDIAIRYFNEWQVGELPQDYKRFHLHDERKNRAYRYILRLTTPAGGAE